MSFWDNLGGYLDTAGGVLGSAESALGDLAALKAQLEGLGSSAQGPVFQLPGVQPPPQSLPAPGSMPPSYVESVPLETAPPSSMDLQSVQLLLAVVVAWAILSR